MIHLPRKSTRALTNISGGAAPDLYPLIVATWPLGVVRVQGGALKSPFGERPPHNGTSIVAVNCQSGLTRLEPRCCNCN